MPTKLNKTKWIDGRLVQGAYFQWLIDNHPEVLTFEVIHIIARKTLGYRKRYAYLQSELFNMYPQKKSSQLKKLKNMGLLEYQKTKGYTYYKLTLPEEIETATLWRGSKTDTPTNETKKEMHNAY